MKTRIYTPLFARLCLLVGLLFVAQAAYGDDDLRQRHRERAKKLKQKALEEATGVRVTTPTPPVFFRQILRDLFVRDLGNGLFLWDFETRTVSTYVRFSIPVANPCPTMIQMQYVKSFRFIRRTGTNYQRQQPPAGPSGAEKPDPPPATAGNGVQDPGELVSEGGGRFTSYDPPGSPIYDGQNGRPAMPANVTADRYRLVFRVEVQCKGGSRDGEVVKRFYWTIEWTIPYAGGTPQVQNATSSVRQISSKEYDNAERLFGQSHN
ncbi:MAG: hypothetical protein ACE5G0_14945 [Rhodothermales bacterium]